MDDMDKYLHLRFRFSGRWLEIVGIYDTYEGMLCYYEYDDEPNEVYKVNLYEPESDLFFTTMRNAWNYAQFHHTEPEQIVGIGKTDGTPEDCAYHYQFVCPHCKTPQIIHTDLQSRYGDLGDYNCPDCHHAFHCTTDDGGCSRPKLYVFDQGHRIATLELPLPPQEQPKQPDAPEGAYSPRTFHSTRLINDGLYIDLGYFDTRKGRVFAIGYDYPNRNEDYFEYYRISEEDWRRLKVLPCKNMTKTECAQWYMDNLMGRQILCNEFEFGMTSYKPWFTDDEI